MRWPSLLLLCVVASSTMLLAQMPTYQVGRPPTAEEIRSVDLTVGPSGKGLPAGSGTAKEGAAIFARKCAVCHGPTGAEGTIGPKLTGIKTLHPFATTIWSFINSSMPRNVSDPGRRDSQLSPAEVYSLTAFILYKNGIIQEDAAMDQNSLPRVRMPTRDRRLDVLVPGAADSKQ